METVGLLLKPWLKVKHTSRDRGKAQWGIPACSAPDFGLWSGDGDHIKEALVVSGLSSGLLTQHRVLLVGPSQLRVFCASDPGNSCGAVYFHLMHQLWGFLSFPWDRRTG